MPCSRQPISYVLLLYTVPKIHNTCPSAHATDITTLGGSHDTNAGKHSHALQIDEKNSKNCAQKHMNAQVCAVRWAHRRHRNAQPMGTDSSTFRPSTGDVTLPESGFWCISHVVAPCSRRIQHKAGTRGAKVDLLAPWRCRRGRRIAGSNVEMG